MNISIVTWNVNSVRSRLHHLVDFLNEYKPDIVLLQEIKVETDKFPGMELEELGYNLAIFGQKTYNGVAILSKHPLDDVMTSLPGDEMDEQARYIEAVVSVPGGALRVASVYVPNGNAVGSEKFEYKMNFFKRLQDHAKELLSYNEVLVIGGDYNVAPTALDVYSPKTLEGSICFHPKEREEFRKIEHLGLYDAFRAQNPGEAGYSWWDYRASGFAQDKGLRIDFLMLSPEAVDKLQHSEVIRSERAKEKPSDHAPVLCQLAL